MKPPAGTPSRMGTVLLGISRVARGRKDGLLQFGDTAQAVLAGLAPLVALLLVGAVLGLISGSRDGVESVAVLAVLWLAPLVISFEVARRWNRAGEWFRFAAAFCWCQLAWPMALVVVMLLMAVLMAGGVSENTAAGLGLACLAGYAFWLHWFLARYGLDLKPLRALAMVLLVEVLTFALFVLPQLADYAVNGFPPSPS